MCLSTLNHARTKGQRPQTHSKSRSPEECHSHVKIIKKNYQPNPHQQRRDSPQDLAPLARPKVRRGHWDTADSTLEESRSAARPQTPAHHKYIGAFIFT